MARWLYLYFMRACARVSCGFLCVCMNIRAVAVCLSLSVTQTCSDWVCAPECACGNVRVALRFIVTLICGRLHQVSQDSINLAGQTALEIDMHVSG